LENMLIYGGIMSGVAQETLDISATLTASCILFCDKEEYSKDVETACINCGKCVACCPVRLHVKNLDDSIINRDFNMTKKLGVSACIGCGACSYVCPAKRYLAQRISFAKDFTMGKRGKKPNSSEYVLLEGEDITRDSVDEDKILHIEDVTHHNVSEIEEMLEMLSKQKNNEEGGNNHE